MDEYARLCITICINMEIISATRNTSAYKLTIILEVHCEETLARCKLSYLTDSCSHVCSLLNCRKQVNGCIIADRHVMEVKCVTASLINHEVNEFITCYSLNIL